MMHNCPCQARRDLRGKIANVKTEFDTLAESICKVRREVLTDNPDADPPPQELPELVQKYKVYLELLEKRGALLQLIRGPSADIFKKQGPRAAQRRRACRTGRRSAASTR